MAVMQGMPWARMVGRSCRQMGLPLGVVRVLMVRGLTLMTAGLSIVVRRFGIALARSVDLLGFVHRDDKHG